MKKRKTKKKRVGIRKTKNKKGGASSIGTELPSVVVPDPPYIPPPPTPPPPPAPPPIIPMPPHPPNYEQYQQQQLQAQQRIHLINAIDELYNHKYYVYQPPRVPTVMNLEVGKEDITMPPTRRPARKGDYKYIGSSENAARGGPNSQRALARKFGTDNTALIDLNRGTDKIRELKLMHQQLMVDENDLPNNQKTAKMQNGFRLYRDPINNEWKSLGNYDFKNRDSGIHGTVRPHPQGVDRVLGRGGKRRRKTKRKRRRRTRKHKRRKRRKTRKR